MVSRWSVDGQSFGQSGGEARADNWPAQINAQGIGVGLAQINAQGIGVGLAQINAQGIGVGLVQISWLPHEQRAIQEESRLCQLDRRAMVGSEGEIDQSSILKMRAIQEGRLRQLERRAAVQMLVPA